jgi:hypothetical protein
VARRYAATPAHHGEQNIVCGGCRGDLPRYRTCLRLRAAPADDRRRPCPYTDTCKPHRGRRARGELRAARREVGSTRPCGAAIKAGSQLCGHHVADIGFYGNSRKIDGRTVPHFQVILGGQWSENAGSYGLAVGSVPSKRSRRHRALTDAYATVAVDELQTGSRAWQAQRAQLSSLHGRAAARGGPEYYLDWQ